MLESEQPVPLVSQELDEFTIPLKISGLTVKFSTQGFQCGALAVEVMDLTDEAASHYPEIRADLKKRGALIGANDLYIAAHARSHDLTLVTNNTAEFRRVRGLKVENWASSPRRIR